MKSKALYLAIFLGVLTTGCSFQLDSNKSEEQEKPVEGKLVWENDTIKCFSVTDRHVTFFIVQNKTTGYVAVHRYYY